MPSRFDTAFSRADDNAFKAFGDPDNKVIVHQGDVSAGVALDVIDQPSDVGDEYRRGGKVQDVAAEYEVNAGELATSGAKIGWRATYKGETYRILRLRPQGGTVTLICGGLSDVEGDRW